MRLTIILLAIFICCHICLAQDVPPVIGNRLVLDANGNLISSPDTSNQAGLWQPGSGHYEFGEYNGTTSPPAVQPPETLFPLQNQQHSPGEKNSYFSGWAGNEIASTPINKPSDARNGVFQKITGSALWSPKSGSGHESLGFTQIELNAMFAFPMFTKESPLLVTPGFAAWFLDQGVSRYDDSLNLYSAKCEFRWLKPLFSQYTAMLGASPGYHGAFQYGGGVFRVPAHIGAIWNYNPRTKWVLGCYYLDRKDDYNWLPFGGVIWEPADLEMRFELLFPNPKVAKRIRWWGSAVGNDVADWIYVAGEFAGERWSFKDDAGRTGDINYSDWRLVLGYERKTTGYFNFAVEVGGLFARKYRDSVHDEDYSIDPALFLRVKAMY